MDVHSGLNASHLFTTFLTPSLTLSLHLKAVSLHSLDLYPKPPPGLKLATRMHHARGDPIQGCVDGKPASAGCITVLEEDTMPVIEAVGGNITDYSLSAIYLPNTNGAYFLGELAKFVHVSPQRFESVSVGGNGPCGPTAEVYADPGFPLSEYLPLLSILYARLLLKTCTAVGESVQLACVDTKGIFRLQVHAPRSAPPSPRSVEL